MTSIGREFAEVLERAFGHAVRWRSDVGDRPVFQTFDPGELRAVLGPDGMPERGEEAGTVLDALARAGELGATASAGPRYFGYVIGSSLPVALAADWLVSAWDQNATLYSCGPGVSVIEEVCAGWLVDLHRQRAASHLHRSALRYLGMGTRVRSLACERSGAVDTRDLSAALEEAERPPIVCVQAGDINTGAVDPLAEICERVHARDGWVHVDGAIGLWALASADHRHLLRGADLADSWTTDAHKWLNVPFDCGMAFVAHPAAHTAALRVSADYLETSRHRDQINTVPEWSRRARSVPVYAALRALGRAGVADLVDRNIGHARHMAARLAGEPGIEVLNDVVLNQVLVRFTGPGHDPDGLTAEVIRRVQREGTCWLSGSVFAGRQVMRVSVCSWLTTKDDIDRSADAIIGCFRDAFA
ncbi:pyridoxal phosphate-dependent decarboxylase family protein [Nonomuraea sp. SYSU D8015]|uniref:pyridoxal phosphate-dependent decarboxylase family protein n=1 Tax=Nonomuraea sp. SYSU D8015 TaxID=2593644 RepID=UPI0016616701|nr:aminotransferase class V-fold PLP-dependent enzyme [Nonomuraea sp. SYSU D8015]